PSRLGSGNRPGIPVSSESQLTNSGEFSSSATSLIPGGKRSRLASPNLFSLWCLYCVQAAVVGFGNSSQIIWAISGFRKSVSRICGKGLFSRYRRARDGSSALLLRYEKTEAFSSTGAQDINVPFHNPGLWDSPSILQTFRQR